MVSETQLAFLRSIDTPTVWPRTEEEARQLAIELLSGLPHLDGGDTLRVEGGEVCRPRWAGTRHSLHSSVPCVRVDALRSIAAAMA